MKIFIAISDGGSIEGAYTDRKVAEASPHLGYVERLTINKKPWYYYIPNGLDGLKDISDEEQRRLTAKACYDENDE